MQARKLPLIFLSFLSFISYAQLTVDAELRPRLEYRHGFKTLFPDDADTASFIGLLVWR